MTYQRILSICLLASVHAGVYAAGLTSQIDSLIQTSLPKATIGINMQNLDGSLVYAHRADTLLYPASSIKLYTAAAALYALGPAYHYETLLSQFGDDTYLSFSGAPDLKSTDLPSILQGISSIKGYFILDATRFRAPYYQAGISYDDLGWYFTAPCSAVILDENKEDYLVDVPQNKAKFAHFSAEKPPGILTIVDHVKWVEPKIAQEQCSLNVTFRGHNTLYLDGCLSTAEQSSKMSFAVPDPVSMVKRVLQYVFKKNHIGFKGKILSGVTPSAAKVLVRHESAPLSELIEVMLQDSNNLYAESITRTLGYQLAQDGSTKMGAFAIKSILNQHIGMDMQSIQLLDGIGTRYNLSTAEHISTLLRHVYNDSTIHTPFLQALPIMGVSGSLKNRMKDSPLVNQVWAKTGTMHDISSLSGFMQTPQGKTVVFSIIVNGVTDVSKAKMFEDKVLGLMYAGIG